jgi:hypothetical protein
MFVCVTLYPLYTEPAQALYTFNPVDLAYRNCLYVLQSICRNVEKLPRSYILDVSSFVPIAGPTPIGPYEIIYEGSINGLEAWAKEVNRDLPSKWAQDDDMVLYQHSYLSRFPH